MYVDKGRKTNIHYINIDYNNSLFDHFYLVYINYISNNLIYILILSSQHFSSYIKRSHKYFPGWNDYSKVKYSIALKNVQLGRILDRLKMKKEIIFIEIYKMLFK